MTVRFRLCCVTSDLARAGCDLPAPRRPRHGVCAWRGRVLLSWCWWGARAAEASSVENCSTERCPGFKSLSRRHSCCAVRSEAPPGVLVERVSGGVFVYLRAW